MTLARRLTWQLLTLVALLLIAMLVCGWLLTWWQLERQLESVLLTAGSTLTALAEIEPDGIDWTPTEHDTQIAREHLKQVVWIVTGPRGMIVDRSESPLPAGLAERLDSIPMDHEIHDILLPEGRWFVLRHELRSSIADTVHDIIPDEDGTPDYPRLEFTVAAAHDGHPQTLRQLAVGLMIAGLACWLAVAAASQWLIRRALSPILEMTDAADRIRANNLQERLALPDRADELRRLAEAFNRAIDRLDELRGEESRFAAEASHQLRTPLTSLRGELDVTLRKPRNAEDYRESLVRMVSQTGRLIRMTDALMLLSNVGPRHIAPRLFPLDEAVTNWIDQYDVSGRIQSSDLQKTVVVTALDDELLSHILQNLVDNAVKYGDTDKPLQITVRRQAARGELIVRNFGPAIPEEDLKRLFEPFFRGVETTSGLERSQSGSGLGLAIVRKIVERTGGCIAVESHENTGTAFMLSWPLDPSALGRD